MVFYTKVQFRNVVHRLVFRTEQNRAENGYASVLVGQSGEALTRLCPFPLVSVAGNLGVYRSPCVVVARHRL